MDEPQLLPDERLFSRDLDGHLLRMDAPTSAMLETFITVSIDGQQIKVPKAVVSTDAEGGICYDEFNNPIPRLTTILDAASSRYDGDVNPIPILCHREHLRPAAVCRICVVQYGKPNDRGRMVVDPKLGPACHQPVVDGMVVETIAAVDPATGEPTPGARRIHDTVKLLVELLAANHLHSGAHPANELEALANRFGITLDGPDGLTSRFPRDPNFAANDPAAVSQSTAKQDPMHDRSSPWFIIDRTACVLCDRCVRGCNEVRGHHVIARAGKGKEAHIAFDWGQLMGESSCVRCGECFISCPTDAITMKRGVKPSPWDFEESENNGAPDSSMLGWLGELLSPRETKS